MPIKIRLDHVMLDKKMSLIELSRKVGITNVNLSKLKTGKVSAIRLSTLEAICDALECQPGDLLEFTKEEAAEESKENKDGSRVRQTLISFNSIKPLHLSFRSLYLLSVSLRPTMQCRGSLTLAVVVIVATNAAVDAERGCILSSCEL